jgi:hypothetical protein
VIAQCDRLCKDISVYKSGKVLSHIQVIITTHSSLSFRFSVFSTNWAGPNELLSSDVVRVHHDVLDCRSTVVFCFIHLNLVVKYGHNVRAADGQSLRVIEHLTDVPVPADSWFQVGGEIFIYMSLVPGGWSHP